MSDDVYARQGFGHRIGLGDRPALLIVDFVNGFADPDQFGGGNIPEAIAATGPLLAHARAAGWPVAQTRIVYASDGADRNAFSLKVPSLASLTEENPASHLLDELRPAPGEFVVCKTVPSAFFGTSLAQWLVGRQVDSLVVAGCTTSGCVRASVVDAMSLGYRVTVARDCVGDRALAPHEANLFDMEQKYADVVASADIIGR